MRTNELFVEHRVSIAPVVPECFGTADAIILDYVKREITVIDLKYGLHKVDAIDNYQLRLYLIGALNEFGVLFEPVRFRGVIVQPRLNHVEEEVLTREELSDFAEVAREAYELACKPQPVYVPGDKQCRWCRAKHVCPARRDQMQMTVFSEDTGRLRELGALQPSDLIKMYPHVDQIIDFCKQVKAAVYQLADNGVDVPGYKMVSGKKGNRCWVDEKTVEKVAKKLKIPKGKVYNTTLKSPAQLKKEVKEHWDEFEKYVEQADGRPTLVPKSDKRNAINTTEIEYDYIEVKDESKSA